jgi:hypothetical protein
VNGAAAAVLRTSAPGGATVELRAVADEATFTIEARSPLHEPSRWEPLRIGQLLDLLTPRSPVWRWLEDHGVLWGAWVGRGAHEIASFTRPSEPTPGAKRAKSK